MGRKKLTAVEVAERTGLSRSTVYRRAKNGEKLTDILGEPGASKPEAGTAAIVEPGDGAASMEWCKAVLWAAEHVNESRMTRQKAGSLIKFSLWQFGRENTKELVVQLVPKALTILDKNKKPDEQAAMEEVEASSIKELEELLDCAIAEAGIA